MSTQREDAVHFMQVMVPGFILGECEAAIAQRLNEIARDDIVVVKLLEKMKEDRTTMLSKVRSRCSLSLSNDILQQLDSAAQENTLKTFSSWREKELSPFLGDSPPSTPAGTAKGVGNRGSHGRQDSQDGDESFESSRDSLADSYEDGSPMSQSAYEASVADDSFESGSTNGRSNEANPFDVQPYRDFFARVDDRWEEGELMATETKLLCLLISFIDRVFESSDNLPQILDGAKDFLCALSNLPGYNRLLGPRLNRGTKRAKEEPDLSITRSVGAILLECASKPGEFEACQEPAEVTKQLIEIKKAIYQFKHGDDSTHENYDSAISNTALHKFIIVGFPTNNLVMHCLHMVWVYHYIANLTLMEALAHLGGKATRLWEAARALAEQVNPDVPFNEGASILEFLVSFVSPAIEKMENDDAWIKASMLTSDLFACLNIVDTPGLSQNRGRNTIVEASDDPRQECLLRRSKAAELSAVGGGVSNHATELYFSGSGDIHGERRLRALRTYLCMYLKEPIQKRLPPEFFSKRGYARNFLGLSASQMKSECSFINPQFFETNHSSKSDIARRIKRSVISKKDDDGKRTIIIHSREQVASLKRLIEAVNC